MGYVKIHAMRKNIVLIGFMGAGKSMVSKSLARKLQRDRVSTDELIEQQEGQKISDIFRDRGEAYFREKEAQLAAVLSARDGLIIDCGGGLAADLRNLDRLKQTGTVFYLQTSPDIILKRVGHQNHRPLLQVPDPLAKIKELLLLRDPIYRQAHHVINTDDHQVEDTAQAIMRMLNHD